MGYKGNVPYLRFTWGPRFGFLRRVVDLHRPQDCSKMSDKSRYTRFLFIGQVYYYMMWYVLQVTDTSIDATFWVMLLCINVNYVLDSTGWYLDGARTAKCGSPRAALSSRSCSVQGMLPSPLLPLRRRCVSAQLCVRGSECFVVSLRASASFVSKLQPDLPL